MLFNMEFFENKNPNSTPTPETLELLLDKSYDLIGDIIRTHADEHDKLSATVLVTTPEAAAKHKLGQLTVRDLDGNVQEISINESNHLNSEEATIERYRLTFGFGAGLELFTTGIQPDVMGDVLDGDATYDDYAKALNATEEHLRYSLRPASPAETQRLVDVLEIGARGDNSFEYFERQFQQHVDGSDTARYAAEENEKNENHPE